jgi:uncharacterized protein YydD (DUF2326 family)
VIESVSSDLNTFKSLHFEKGLNVLLATKSPGATDRHSRNGAGKSSLVELVNFVLGSKAGKDSIFCSPALRNHSFGLKFDLGKDRISASRNGAAASKIAVAPFKPDWPLQPRMDRRTQDQRFTVDEWRRLLGHVWFSLPHDERREIFGPTFRSLFSYFARRQNSGGFTSPVQQSAKQALWDQQVAVSYLLGLDPSLPQQLQIHREREKGIRQIRLALKGGGFPEFSNSAAELRTQSAIIEEQTKRLRKRIDDFRVVPQYEELETEANSLTRRLAELSDEDTIDRELIARLESSLVDEAPPAVPHLQRLYSEAGVSLPDVALRRFDDVRDFHQKIVSNRRQHLSAEIGSAKARIGERADEKTTLDSRRSQIMAILRSGGALDQFMHLQEEVSRLDAQLAQLRRQSELAEQLESSKSELAIDRQRLVVKLRSDLTERQAIIKDAILLFEELSDLLYERAGSLVVDVGENGPIFRVDIESSRSKGINNMQIFCFDLMLMELCQRRGIGPGFLIHDSHLFDGVDERQIAKALEIGAKRAHDGGFQYIVTMNSDALPRDGFTSGFNIDDFVLPVRLTDATDDGGLFGIRFH